MLVVIYLSLLVMSAMAQVTIPGPCQEFPGVSDFNITMFAGTWYDYAHYTLTGPYPKCIQGTLSQNPNGTLTCVFEQLSNTMFNDHVEEITMLALNNGPYFIFVDPNNSSRHSTIIKVFSTDYVSYAIHKTCANVGLSSTHYCSIATRSRKPSRRVLDQIEQALIDNDIPQQFFVKTDQNNCPEDHF